MQTTKSVVKIVFTDDTRMTVSRGHKFYIDSVETFAENLKPNDTLDSIDSKKHTVKTIEVTETALPVYSPLNVVPDHKYATANGIVNGNCAFIGSTSTLVDPDCLDKMVPVEPVQYKYGYSMKIWQPPVKGALYVIGVDSATGTR